MTVDTGAAYFDRLYAKDPDPWKFASSSYEREKYAATLGALPHPRFRRAFEAGCSIGVLTLQLAARCDELIATDIADAALDQARTRCTGLSHVRIERMAAPGEWPAGRFDLMIFSEVLYYLGIPGIHQAAARTLSSIEPGGTVILVNYRGDTGVPCSGDQAADTFIASVSSGMAPVHRVQAAQYRLDVLRAA